MKAACKAFTLIELVAAMSIFSAIFVTMLLALHAVQNTTGGVTDGIASAVRQQRFAIQLRTDAHQAHNAVLRQADPQEPAKSVLELTLADRQLIRYRLFEDRIERRASRGDAPVHQESFPSSPVLHKGWSLDAARPYPLLTVYLHQFAATQPNATATLTPIRIDAALRVAAPPATISTTSSLP